MTIGTKETQELLEGIKEAVKLGKSVRDIVADGVDANDIPAASTVIKAQSDKLDMYNAAFQDVSKIKEELKDLDSQEIAALFFQIVEAVEEIDKH